MRLSVWSARNPQQYSEAREQCERSRCLHKHSGSNRDVRSDLNSAPRAATGARSA